MPASAARARAGVGRWAGRGRPGAGDRGLRGAEWCTAERRFVECVVGWRDAQSARREALHRGEARRARREQAVAGEREQAPPWRSRRCIAAHRETIACLDAALLGLPEPYQGTLLPRYFEDLKVGRDRGAHRATGRDGEESAAARPGKLLRERTGNGGEGDDGVREEVARGADRGGVRARARGARLRRGTGVIGAIVGVAMTKWLLAAAALALAAFCGSSGVLTRCRLREHHHPGRRGNGGGAARRDRRSLNASPFLSATPRPRPAKDVASSELVTFVGRCVEKRRAADPVS